MVIVAAAANHGSGWTYPAVFESVIGVAAADLSDPYGISFYPHEALEFGARANGQRARALGGALRTINGTSFAAPIVTGHIATLFHRFGYLELTEVRQELARLASRAYTRGANLEGERTSADQV